MSQAKPAKTEHTADQVAAMQSKPQPQHQWLQRLVGEWTYEAKEPTESGETRDVTGSERVRGLGDVWILAEGQGEMPDGSPALTLMTLGYDSAKAKFVGNWVGSMMTHQWIYEGELDAAERVLTLSSRGPSMAGDGTMADYRDQIELEGQDRRVMRALTKGPDGQWQTFMTMNYTRKRA